MSTNRMEHGRGRRWATALLLGSLPATVAGAHGAGTTDPALRDQLREAKAATEVFADTEAASAAGYGPFPDGAPLHECIEGADGAMGFHWVNPDLLDTTLELTRPEVLVSAPRSDGSLELVALEYVVFGDPWAQANPDTVPTLFGRQLTFHSVTQGNNPYEIPSFWELHAWVHRPNPDGPFAGFNPTVRCR